MRNQRRRSALQKGEGSNSNDYFSSMPYEVLIMILSLLPVKDAVVTSSLSKEWRFLWCNLNNLNFDGSEALYKIDKNRSLYSSERSKYIHQVNSVIRRHADGKTVHKFRINFDLGDLNQAFIDEWVHFAVNKKVEILELDIKNSLNDRNLRGNYEFPLTLSVCKWPYSEARVVSLKKVYLNNVTVRDAALDDLLTRSPYLESLSIHGSNNLIHIRVGGRCVNLRHFEIRGCYDIKSLYLSDLDLVSFKYRGMPTDLRLTNLPKLRKVKIYQGLLDDVLFRQISSCVSYVQTLSFTLYVPKRLATLVSIPQMPNVKKLMLTMGVEEDDCLLEVASIVEACPNLETFIIKLLWFSPVKRRRKARHVANDHHLLKNLKLFKILGYFGRISDFELVAYVIDNAVALEKIVIDPRCLPEVVIFSEKDLLKKEEAARSSAERRLKAILPKNPPGVKLVIL